MFPTTTKCRRSRFGQGDKGGDVSTPRRQCRQEQACLFIASFGDFSYRTGHQRPGFANQPAACDPDQMALYESSCSSKSTIWLAVISMENPSPNSIR